MHLPLSKLQDQILDVMVDAITDVITLAMVHAKEAVQVVKGIVVKVVQDVQEAVIYPVLVVGEIVQVVLPTK